MGGTGKKRENDEIQQKVGKYIYINIDVLPKKEGKGDRDEKKIQQLKMGKRKTYMIRYR